MAISLSEALSMYLTSSLTRVCVCFSARNAFVMIGTGVVAYMMLSFDIDVFSLTGDVKPGLPPFEIPKFTVEVGNFTMTTGEVFSVSAQLILSPTNYVQCKVKYKRSSTQVLKIGTSIRCISVLIINHWLLWNLCLANVTHTGVSAFYPCWYNALILYTL